MPMLMVTGQKPIKKSKQGRFQILDVVAMMGPITKYAHQMASADNIPSRVREAFRLAEEEKPGATHIELPEDIADEYTNAKPLKRSHVRRPSADPKSVRQAVEAQIRAVTGLDNPRNARMNNTAETRYASDVNEALTSWLPQASCSPGTSPASAASR